MGRAATLFIIAAALVGVVLSGMSLYEHVVLASGLSTGPSFCNISAAVNCDLVNASKYAVLFGVPLASYGILFYLTTGVLFGVYLWTDSRLQPTTMADILLLNGLSATLFSIYLFYISHFIIGTVCILCLGMYCVNLLFLAAGWFGGRSRPIGERLRIAFAAMLRFAAILFSRRKKDGSGMARLGAVVFAVTALVTYLVPDFLPRFLESRAADRGQAALTQWLNSPQKEITLDPRCELGGDFYKGTLGAPVTIVEFADMECPFCRYFYTMAESFLAQYEGQLLFVFKHYPLDSQCNPGIPQGDGDRYSCFAAQFVICAGEQGKFWEALEYLFELGDMASHHPTVTIKEDVEECMDRLGLDSVAVRECLRTGRALPQIARDIKEGDRLGLAWTPYIFVNGKLIERPDEQGLQAVISHILFNSRDEK